MPGRSFRLSIQSVNILIAVITLLIVLLQIRQTKAAAFEEQVCDISADSALGLEHYPAAIALYRNFLSSHPDNALAHYHLGFAYGMIGHGSQEIDEYRKAAKLGNRQWDLFLNLGLAYLEQQDYPNAINSLQTSAVLGPEHPEAHFNLATAYEGADRWNDAMREILTSLQLAPADLDMRNTKAIICAESGDLECTRSE